MFARTLMEYAVIPSYKASLQRLKKCPNSLTSINFWLHDPMSSAISPIFSETSKRINLSISSWHAIFEDEQWRTTTTEYQCVYGSRRSTNWNRTSPKFSRGPNAGNIVENSAFFWICTSSDKRSSEAPGWRHTSGTPKGSRWSLDGVCGTQWGAVTNLTGLPTGLSSETVLASWTNHTTVPGRWISNKSLAWSSSVVKCSAST